MSYSSRRCPPFSGTILSVLDLHEEIHLGKVI
jgi:hypothetical protein